MNKAMPIMSGCKNMTIQKIIENTPESYKTEGTPLHLHGLKEQGNTVNPKEFVVTGEDTTIFSTSSTESIDVVYKLAYIYLEDLAFLLGQEMVNGELIEVADPVKPSLLIRHTIDLKEDGGKRMVSFFNAKLQNYEYNSTNGAEATTEDPVDLHFKAIPLPADNRIRSYKDYAGKDEVYKADLKKPMAIPEAGEPENTGQ